MKFFTFLFLSILLFFTGCKTTPDDSTISNTTYSPTYVAVVNGSGISATIEFLNGVLPDDDDVVSLYVDETLWKNLYNNDFYNIDWVITATDAYGHLSDYRISNGFPQNSVDVMALCELNSDYPYPTTQFDIPVFDTNGKRTNVSVINTTTVTIPAFEIQFILGDDTYTYQIPDIAPCTKYFSEDLNDLDFSKVTGLIINGIDYDLDSLPLMVKDNMDKLSNMDFSFVRLSNGKTSFIPLFNLSILAD